MTLKSPFVIKYKFITNENIEVGLGNEGPVLFSFKIMHPKISRNYNYHNVDIKWTNH